MATVDGIGAFWAWWPAVRERIEAGIEGGGIDDLLVQEISKRVEAVGDGLDWELAPGAKARHAFCLSAVGDPVARRITERWLRAAPAPDAIWEYHPARRGNAERRDVRLKIEGHDLAVGDFVGAFEIDADRELLDVRCFHPAFPTMDERLRRTATFLMLDGALGEDGVERWIGGIESAPAAPDGARPIAELRTAIEALAKTATGERFGVMRGQDPQGRPVFVTLNLALKRIDHLACDSHVTVDIALLTPNAHGLTTNEEAEQLNALEDELLPLLPEAAYFGRETRAGRRVLHYFVPSDSPGRTAVADWASRYPDRDVRVAWSDDPHWEARARFR